MFFGLITLISATYIIFNKSNEKEEKKLHFMCHSLGFLPFPPAVPASTSGVTRLWELSGDVFTNCTKHSWRKRNPPTQYLPSLFLQANFPAYFWLSPCCSTTDSDYCRSAKSLLVRYQLKSGVLKKAGIANGLKTSPRWLGLWKTALNCKPAHSRTYKSIKKAPQSAEKCYF